ncbi:MAG: hypothetical protein ABII75_01600 [Candidatus Omnitrophota bacterium]
MKKTVSVIFLSIMCLFACGFKSGSDMKYKTETKKPPDAPVYKYEDVIIPQNTPRELYQQYRLIIQTSLEEAAKSIKDNPQWAYRMAHNAYKYMGLLQALIEEKYQDKFSLMHKDMRSAATQLRKSDMSRSEKRRLERELEKMAETLKSDFKLIQVQTWIKK